ncbi:MAG: hypothetical protein JNM66_29385 [Bryobacterales bacterium]|nr:hypothetical protein [Bryobacterales bacterium]
MKPKVLFYCQHVLGMGHMVRSREIVRGLGDFDVCFVNGGEPVDGFAFPDCVRVVQLPPIRSDAAFAGIDASEAVKQERRDLLLTLLEREDPAVLIIEMFPFGRRKFAFELVPLLEEIAQRGRRCLVVSSVRDILVGKRDQARHEEQACRQLNQFFDLVLVHSDPAFQALDETFLRASDLRCPVRYTGFVTEPLPAAEPAGRTSTEPLLIASAGGGRVGFSLLASAIQVSRVLATATPHQLRVYSGPYLPDEEFDQLVQLAVGAPWVRLERFATRFVEELASADLLISMAGYNTCMNILSTGVRALVQPFTGNGNEEQTIRAVKLERLGLLGVLRDEDMAPGRFSARIRSALLQPRRTGASALDLNGVAHTAELLSRACREVAAYV